MQLCTCSMMYNKMADAISRFQQCITDPHLIRPCRPVSLSNTQGVLQHLKSKVEELLHNSIPTNTQAIYDKDIKSLPQFQS